MFFLGQNESKPVQMMYQMRKLPYNYIPDHGLQILELPYVGEELSMFILLPAMSDDGSDPLLKVQNLQTATSTEKAVFACSPWVLKIGSYYSLYTA